MPDGQAPNVPAAPLPPPLPIAPAGVQPAAPPVYLACPVRPRGWGMRVLDVLMGLALVFSFVLNLCLLVALGAQAEGEFKRVTVRQGRKDQKIAVYALAGVLDGRAADTFAAFLRAAEEDSVRALVLRVESPGGGVGPSDQIHQMVKAFRSQGKVIVVSMGNVAASGAYYVSAPADEIFAESTTVTGSIGVFSAWLVVANTLEKIGTEVVTLKSRHAEGWKDAMSPFQRPDDRQRAYLQSILDQLQDRFEQVVRDGRGSKLKTRPASYEMLRTQGGTTRPVRVTETEPFNGKVYLANEALALGLIDAIGYQDDAIHRAAELAGLSRPSVVQYLPRRKLLEQFLGQEGQESLHLNVRTLDEFQTPRLQMLWKVE